MPQAITKRGERLRWRDRLRPARTAPKCPIRVRVSHSNAPNRHAGPEAGAFASLRLTRFKRRINYRRHQPTDARAQAVVPQGRTAPHNPEGSPCLVLDAARPVAEAVHKLTIEKREGGEGTRLWVDDLAGLLGLVEVGAVELHPWNARMDDIEHPDMLVFDLDPGEGVGWELVIETALRLRRMLKDEELEPWPKLTGARDCT
jgi:hypothetical protein